MYFYFIPFLILCGLLLLAAIYRPVRKILPDFGGLDFSPLVVLLVIWCIARLLTGAADSLPLGA